MHKFNEPWTTNYGAAYGAGEANRIILTDATGTPAGHARVERAAACVNALAGIEDPEAAMKAVRWLADLGMAYVYNNGTDKEIAEAEAALALLTPAPHPTND